MMLDRVFSVESEVRPKLSYEVKSGSCKKFYGVGGGRNRLYFS